MTTAIKAFMDTERDQKDNVIEIGIAVFVNGELKKTFERRIKTDVKIDPLISKLTGITNNCLKKAPSTTQVVKEINEFVKELGVDKLICHTWGQENYYIQKMNRHQEEQLNIVCKDVQMEITKPITKEKYHNIGLEKMARALGMEFEQKHNALDDAIMTGKVFSEAQKNENRNKIITLAKKEIEITKNGWADKTDFEKVETVYNLTKNHKLKNENDFPTINASEKRIIERLIQNAKKVRKGAMVKHTEKGKDFFENSLRRFREDYRRLNNLHKEEGGYYVENKSEVNKILSYAKDLTHEISIELFENNPSNNQMLEEAFELREMAYARTNLQIIFLDDDFLKEVKNKIKRLATYLISSEISNERKYKIEKRYIVDIEKKLKKRIEEEKEMSNVSV